MLLDWSWDAQNTSPGPGPRWAIIQPPSIVLHGLQKCLLANLYGPQINVDPVIPWILVPGPIVNTLSIKMEARGTPYLSVWSPQELRTQTGEKPAFCFYCQFFYPTTVKRRGRKRKMSHTFSSNINCGPCLPSTTCFKLGCCPSVWYPRKCCQDHHIRSQEVGVVHEMSNVYLVPWWRFQGGRGYPGLANNYVILPLHLRLRENYRRSGKKDCKSQGIRMSTAETVSSRHDREKKWNHPVKSQSHSCLNRLDNDNSWHANMDGRNLGNLTGTHP